MAEATWKKWCKDETPYVHWWGDADGKLSENLRDFESLAVTPRFDPAGGLGARAGGRIPAGQARDSASELGKKYFGGGTPVPVPRGSLNLDWPKDPQKVPDWTAPVKDRLPDDLEDDTVIVGVIDTGVALGHRAFRDANGRSRVIASWQQTSLFRGQCYLPFGQEVYACEIDKALRDHCHGGRLDEEAFNRALCLVEPDRIRGQRDLDHRAAHGTHVMDLAAGHDPDSEAARRIRMVVVNLPTQYLHGSAGNFLMYYAAFAVARVFDLAAAAWEHNHDSQPGSYPVALSLAYGMMAGPKDGSMPLEQFMEGIVEARGNLPTSICMPAGNENLARAVGPRHADAGTWTDPWVWRTLPSDRSSNFLEIWIDPRSARADQIARMRFSIHAPDGTAYDFTGAQDNHHYDMADVGARLYFRIATDPDTGTPTRLWAVLATAPTLVLSAGPDVPQAPAGLWRVAIRPETETDFVAFVQSDQSAKTHSLAGLGSYLDDADYQRFETGGRLRDSFSYARGHTPEPLEPSAPRVTRFGTQNALATTPAVSAIAGYRHSDGRPAVYSATAAQLFPQFIGPIQAAYVTEDAPAHYGVLAAGARDGSSVAFRGTSMACAMATRRASLAMLAPAGTGTAGVIGSSTWHAAQAAQEERRRPEYYAEAAEPKIGSGRVRPTPGRDHRFDRPDRLGRQS